MRSSAAVKILIAALAAVIGVLIAALLGAGPTGALIGGALAMVAAVIGLQLRRRARAAKGSATQSEMRAIAARLERIEQRLDRVETSSIEVVRRGLSPIALEIGELGGLVRQMAEQIDMHEAVLQEALTGSAPAAPEPEPEPESTGWTHAEVMEVAQRPLSPPAREVVEPPANVIVEPPRAVEDPARRDAVRVGRALERGALELHLEPIVALPQRRVIGYTALALLRDDEDALIPAPTVRETAARSGLSPAVDTLVVDRAVRIARRLKERGRDIVLNAAIAEDTVAGGGFFNEILRRLESNADLAGHLVLEFRAAAFMRMGAAERERLAGLAARGFRFSLAAIEEIDPDAGRLSALGVRQVRTAAATLIDPAAAATSRIHPADLPGLFRRHGIALVATGVASEPALADLLDVDLRLATGDLFGSPRPVRPEIFAGAPADAAPPAIAPPVRPPEPRQGMRAIARSA